ERPKHWPRRWPVLPPPRHPTYFTAFFRQYSPAAENSAFRLPRTRPTRDRRNWLETEEVLSSEITVARESIGAFDTSLDKCLVNLPPFPPRHPGKPERGRCPWWRGASGCDE